MSANTHYDVIIVGAGPAGLAVGSELSKKLKVLVIDKKKSLGHTTKSWFVPRFVCDDGVQEDIRPYLYEGVRRFLCHTQSGVRTAWDAHLPGGYWYIKEHGLLEHWGKQIRRNRSRVLLECTYEDHDVGGDQVKVVTSKGVFTARLLVDASGHDSDIKAEYDIKEDYYWWSVYGCIADHPDGVGNMKVGDYLLWGTFRDTTADPDATLQEGRPVFEYEILDDNTSFPMILYLKKHKVSLDVMKTEFEHVLRSERATHAFHDVHVREWKYGYYPSGGLSQHIAEDHVVFIGDAGCWSTPCGWGMGFILENYRKYAGHLIEAVDRGHFKKEELADLIRLKIHERHELLLNELAARFLSNASASQLDRFIRFWEKPGTIYCEKVFTLTTETKDLKAIGIPFIREFGIRDLLGIFPKEEIPHLLEEGLAFAANFIVEEVNGLLQRLGLKKPRPEKLNGGFDFE